MHLRPATDEEMRTRDALTFSAWGPPLQLQSYLTRERRLRAHRWSKEAMETWLWVGDDDATLASCETFRVGCTGGEAYEVASVFTDAPLRGKGHASAMLQALVQRLRRTRPPARAVTLYSDVGPALYERLGFVARPAVDWTFSPLESAPARGTEPVSESQLEARLAEGLSQGPTDPGAFALAPCAAQLDWHLERERIVSAELGLERPSACGAHREGAVIFWAAHYGKRELLVLLLRATEPYARRALLTAARVCAHRAGLDRVRVWETVAGPEAGDGGARAARGGSLPMILPLDASVPPEAWLDIPRALWV